MSFTSGRFASQAQAVLAESNSLEKDNTVKAYAKSEEFIEFCEYVYCDLPEYSRGTVTEEKLFGFLYYQAYRSLRKRGVKQGARSAGTSSRTAFDPDDYEAVMSRPNIARAMDEEEAAQLAGNNNGNRNADLVQYSTLNQYLCAVLNLWKSQRDLGANNVRKDVLRSDKVMRLMDVVANRGKIHKKATYKEKYDHEVAPFAMSQEIEHVATALFRKNCTSESLSQASLRDRFTMLMTTYGILRGESMFKAELSDLTLFNADSTGIVPHDVLVMRIAFGKTNQNSTLFGRTMRHRDHLKCPIGALGLYLFSRFHFAGERLCFTENRTWFDVKLLVKSGSKDHTVSVKDQVYAKAISDACKDVGVVPKKFIHFGRSTGAIEGEVQDLSSDEIRNIGNWNPDTMQRFYSSKLPLQAMRKMAGHSKDKAMFFIPRAGVEPPESLRRLIFPFVTEELIQENVHLERSTAVMFLKSLDRLRSIILQDVVCLKQSGLDHAIFHVSPFNSAEFEAYSTSLRAYMASARDPTDTSIQAVIPGLTSMMNNQYASIRGELGNLAQAVESGFQRVERGVTDRFRTMARRFWEVFQTETTETTDTTTELEANETRPAIANATATNLEDNAIEVTRNADETLAPAVEFQTNHQSVTDMYNLMHGAGRYALIVPGGLIELDRRFKAKWRRTFTPQKAKYYSRMKYIVSRVDQSVANGSTLEEALTTFDNLFQRIRSISVMEKHLKDHPDQ